jgi:transposase/DNA-directed RNA polymerase subunit N (RpoN/RPB10)
VIEHAERVDGIVTLDAWARCRGARCAHCGQDSTRVHSRYGRRVADTAIAGTPVVLRLRVRRFFCDRSECAAKTFVEQVAGLTQRHARRSTGLRRVLEAIALALAGRAGARLAARLGIGVGRGTLLRLLRALPDPVAGTVAALGVDEFALRRGQHYATLLIDMATHHPVDVFDGREVEDFAEWLRAHPGVELICRDRCGAYAAGARDGAPAAVQVADRWHLWHNLCEHVEELVGAHHACLPEPPVTTAEEPADRTAAAEPDDRAAAAQTAVDAAAFTETTRLARRTRERHRQVQALRGEGLGLRAIAERLGLDRKTVRRFARATGPEQLVAAGARASLLDAYKPYLHQRLAAGVTNAAELHAEIAVQGYPGSYQTLARYLHPLCAASTHQIAALPQRPPPVTVRQVVGWLTGHPDDLDPDDAVRIKAIRSRCPELDAAAKHIAGLPS